MADVVIFEGKNFQGRSESFSPGGHRLFSADDMNDMAQSIQVPQGMVAIVFTDADAGGGYGTSADLMEDCADLSQYGLSGNISFLNVFEAEMAAGFVWARGATVNGEYVPGHWERKRAGGQSPNTPVVAVAPPSPAHDPSAPPFASGPPGVVVRDHRPPVIAPGDPALPHLLDISQINGGPWQNPAFDTSDPNWSSNVVGGQTFDGSTAHEFEWVSVLNPTIQQDDEVGIAGTAVHPEDSGADLPFTHPFGPDFEFAIVPDPPYANLLAPANRDPSGVYQESIADAQALGVDASSGVLGLEVDGALVPQDYRPLNGERVAVYGRWIVDAGHPEFHTEIHPPLLMARARTVDANNNTVARTGDAATLFQLWSRPYQSGQIFSSGGDKNLNLRDYITDIAETYGDIQAFPPIFPKPFDGVHLVSFTVRPPVPLQAHGPVMQETQLQCSYHFTVNGACGVEVLPSPSDPQSVLVVLALNSVGYPALPEPSYHFDSYSIDALLKQVPSGTDFSWYESLLVDIVKLKGNVQFRRYDPPRTSQTQDSVNVVPFTPLDSLPRSTVATDATQPFPVYGWLKLQWVSTTLVNRVFRGVLEHR